MNDLAQRCTAIQRLALSEIYKTLLNAIATIPGVAINRSTVALLDRNINTITPEDADDDTIMQLRTWPYRATPYIAVGGLASYKNIPLDIALDSVYTYIFRFPHVDTHRHPTYSQFIKSWLPRNSYDYTSPQYYYIGDHTVRTLITQHTQPTIENLRSLGFYVYNQVKAVELIWYLATESVDDLISKLSSKHNIYEKLVKTEANKTKKQIENNILQQYIKDVHIPMQKWYDDLSPANKKLI